MWNRSGGISRTLLMLIAIVQCLNLSTESGSIADTGSKINAGRVTTSNVNVTAVASDSNNASTTSTGLLVKFRTTDDKSAKTNAGTATENRYNTNAQFGAAGSGKNHNTTTPTTSNAARRINTLFRELTDAVHRTVADIRNAGISASHKISVAIQAVRTNPVAQIDANGTVKLGTVKHAGTTFPGIGPAMRWADAEIHGASDRMTRKVTAAIHQFRVASAKPSTRLAIKQAMGSMSTSSGSGASAGNATAIAIGIAGSDHKSLPESDRTGANITKQDVGTGTEPSKDTKHVAGTGVLASATADRGVNIKPGGSTAPTTTGTPTSTVHDTGSTVTASTRDMGQADTNPGSGGGTSAEPKAPGAAGNVTASATERTGSGSKVTPSTSAEPKAPDAAGNVTASAPKGAGPGFEAKPSTSAPAGGAARPDAVGAKATPGLAANASIVFEAYEVRRPEVAGLAIGALRYELYKLGYIATPRDVKSQLGGQLALSARTNPELTAQVLLTELSNAHNEYSSATEFGKLATTLSRAVTKAMENPALVVTDQAIRESFKDALLDLALVNGKLARDPAHVADAAQLQRASEDMMAEWVRTFISTGITQKKNGPEAEKLYMRVRGEQEKSGRGGLEVTVDDPNVQVYVNEEFRSPQRTISDLVPGRYRVLLMTPNDDARLFLADVAPNQTTHLDVQWAISSNLVISASTAGFVFPSTTHPEASALACKLAAATGRGSDKVVVLGMESMDDQWRVVASLYGTRTCQLLRRGYVTGERPTSKQTGALASFIAQGKRAPEVAGIVEADAAVFQTLVSDRSSQNAVPITPPEAPDSIRARGWMALGGSVALVAGGGYAVHAHERPLGYTAIGLGAALGALAIYSFAQAEKRENASHITIAPLRSGAALGWARSF